MYSRRYTCVYNVVYIFRPLSKKRYKDAIRIIYNCNMLATRKQMILILNTIYSIFDTTFLKVEITITLFLSWLLWIIIFKFSKHSTYCILVSSKYSLNVVAGGFIDTRFFFFFFLCRYYIPFYSVFTAFISSNGSSLRGRI